MSRHKILIVKGERTVKIFSIIVKKKLKQTLFPLGYGNWKSLFYKLERDLFFLICVKGRFCNQQSIISTYIDVIPYCGGFNGAEDLGIYGQVKDSAYQMLNRIMPERFTSEYYHSLVAATSEVGTLQNLDGLCRIIEEHILPYLHRFTDLEFCYNELTHLVQAEMQNKNPFAYSQALFGLSIKLRRYDNATLYIDRRISFLTPIYNGWDADLTRMKGGDIKEKPLQRQKRNLICNEDDIRYQEEQVEKMKKELVGLCSAKEALLSKDDIFLESYIREIEADSKQNLRKMLGEKATAKLFESQ